MTRMEEYHNLCSRLDITPETAAETLKRAKARRRRNRCLRPLTTAAAVFCLFVGIVNLSPSVAAVCMEIPFLDKLTHAVMFSPSLQKAVEHDYVQPMGLEKTQNGVTVRVEHVIVDQKQVNIFYTITSEQQEYLVAVPDILEADSGEGVKAAIVYGNDRVTMGEMRHILVDFDESDVPPQMRLAVNVMEVSFESEKPTDQEWQNARSSNPVASFDLLMTFDPAFTEAGRIMELDREFELDGNRFAVSRLCVYPSHIRIELSEESDNESWIKSLHFHLELNDGTIIKKGGNGISAYGDPDTPSMTTYMAESSYFTDADCFRLVITGADFLEKEFGKTYIDLANQKAKNIPDGHEFVSEICTGDSWELEFLHPDDGISHVQVFGEFYDTEGSRISTDGMWWSGGDDGTVEQPVMRKSGYRLNDFSGSEVWIEPHYSYFWYPDDPVIVEIAP